MLFQHELLRSAVAAEYLQCTSKGTPAYFSHSGATLYKTYVASQRNLVVYTIIYLNVRNLDGIAFSIFSLLYSGRFLLGQIFFPFFFFQLYQFQTAY